MYKSGSIKYSAIRFCSRTNYFFWYHSKDGGNKLNLHHPRQIEQKLSIQIVKLQLGIVFRKTNLFENFFFRTL